MGDGLARLPTAARPRDINADLRRNYLLLVALLFFLGVSVSGFFWLDPRLDNLYWRLFYSQGLERQFGFHGTYKQVNGDRCCDEAIFVITDLSPGSPLARAGLRVGDAPFEHHGAAEASLYWAVWCLAQGKSAEVGVFNINDKNWIDSFRVIQLKPDRAFR